MKNLKEDLIRSGVVIDNEYCDKYIHIVSCCSQDYENSQEENSVVHRHHIIPRYFFKKNGVSVDNSPSNIAVLSVENHILAHYYLWKCSPNDSWKWYNVLAVNYLLYGKKFCMKEFDDSELLFLIKSDVLSLSKKNLYYRNPMHDVSVREKHDEIMRSDIVRNKISSTMKRKACNGELFPDEHRRKLSESQIGTMYVHQNGFTTRIRVSDFYLYAEDGWLQGNGKTLSRTHKDSLIKAHIGFIYSDESKRKMSESHIGKSPSNKGKIMVRRGKEIKYIDIHELNDYISLGFICSKKYMNTEGVVI